jgi:hypothetical protein
MLKKLGAWPKVKAFDPSNSDSTSSLSSHSWNVLRHNHVPSVVQFLEIIEYFVKMWTMSWRLDGRLSVEYFGPQFWSKYVRASREDFFDLVMSDGPPKDAEWGKTFRDFVQVCTTLF